MATDLIALRHEDEIRSTWQARALVATRHRAIGMVVLSVIAHNYDEGDTLLTLLRVVFPGFESIRAPFLCSAARIAKTGAVVADVVTRHGTIDRDVAIFSDTAQMQSYWRRLADDLKADDEDRCAMFAALKAWVVADRRIDPLMDPRDPEARRLVH